MTVDDAARELEVSPSLVYKLCRAGKLGFLRIGVGRGVIRIDREQVEAYRRGAVVPPAPAGGEAPARVRRVRGLVIRDRLAEIERRKRAGGKG